MIDVTKSPIKDHFFRHAPDILQQDASLLKLRRQNMTIVRVKKGGAGKVLAPSGRSGVPRRQQRWLLTTIATHQVDNLL